MAYATATAPGKVAQKNGSNGATIWIYKSADSIAVVGVADYFSNGFDLGMEVGDQVIVVNTTTGGVSVANVVVVTTDGAASISGGTFAITATGAIDPGAKVIQLDHASTLIAATIADASLHAGLVVITMIDAGTEAHTVTLTAGTYNEGGDTIATFNANGETLVVLFDDAGVGVVVSNIGAVALS